VVDGVPVSIYSLSATGGEEPGEYLFLCDSLLEKTESPGEAPTFLRPAGAMALSLPMINRQGVQVAQAQAMLEVGDVTARYALPLPAPVQLEDAQLAFADVFASPASVVLAYTITSLAPPQPDAEGADDAPDWPSIRPVDAQGQPAGTLRESYSMLTLLPDGRAQRRYQLTYTPAAQPQPLRLQLPDGKIVDPF
jgi:hypothetical protein